MAEQQSLIINGGRVSRAPFHATFLAQPSVPQNSPGAAFAPRCSCAVMWFLGAFVTWRPSLCAFTSWPDFVFAMR